MTRFPAVATGAPPTAAPERVAPVVVRVIRDPEAAAPAQRAAFGSGKGLLVVHAGGGTVRIGPVARPGARPCAVCAVTAERRVRDAHSAPAPGPRRVVLGEAWLAWAREMVRARLRGDIDDAVVHSLSLPDGTVREDRLLALPDCRECSPGRPPTPMVSLRPRVTREPGAGTGRVRPMIPLERLRAVLVNPVHGPIGRVFRDAEAPLAFVGADAGGADRAQAISGYGRSGDFHSAQQVAILECLERLAGYRPSGPPVAVASPAELGDDAVDLPSLGLPDPRWDGHPGSQLRPFRPDTATAWVAASDVLGGREVLLPEHVAYWGVRDAPGNARFVYESSNGCALGGCLEEAVLYGALEVVERDAFLLHWYARLTPVPLDPASVRDEISRDHLAVIEDEGFEIHLLDITTAVGVPVVWALALDVRAQPHPIASLSAAAAHPDPEGAVRGALAEVSAMCVLRRRAAPQQRSQLLALLRDPVAVQTLEDHVSLYTLPEALGRLRWALDPRREPVAVHRRFRGAAGRWPGQDVAAMARYLLEAMERAGMRPLAVRQTTAREESLGLEVVKMIAPGALPMTFGHVHHRTRGFPRLDAARRATGRTGPLDPHPFP